MKKEGSQASTAGRAATYTYKTIAKESFVDESLFGSKAGSRKGNPAKDASARGARDALHATAAAAASAAVTLTTSQLQRMLADAPDTSPEHLAAVRREAQARREQEQAAAKARKEKMMTLQEEAKHKAPLTESEQIQAAVDESTLSHAQHLLEEEKDEVKAMNAMVHYAQVMAIRDRQRQDKAAQRQQEQREDQRLDAMMEVERIRALEAYAARDQQRVAEQRRCRSILQEQLDERQRQKQAAEELQDQERILMLKELERLKQAEVAAGYQKQQRAAALMAEVAASNAAQISRKQLEREREAAEELRIAEYIRHKTAREEAIAAEKERVAKEKELETARLRGMQQKILDTRSAEDELRAKRYQESREREWRASERAAAERQAAIQRDLAVARETQLRSKLSMAATLAQVERREFSRVLEVNQAREADKAAQAEANKQINEAYKRDLMAQIQSRHEASRLERASYLEEGARVRQQQRQEVARLEQIKARKLAEMQAAGVPDKYAAELARMRLRSH